MGTRLREAISQPRFTPVHEAFLDEHLQDALILVPSVHLSALHPWGSGGQVF